jgi:nucleotide-binding universal stress UspA family protein
MFRTIIWATDGSAAADRALPYAKELAAGDGRSLVVVHSKEFFAGRAGGYPVLADDEDLEAKIAAQAAKLRREGLDVILKVGSAMAVGAAHVIAGVAHEVDADLIVVGTRGHSAIGALLVGSVTQQLLHIASCPVLAVPPGAPAERERGGEVAAAVPS